MITNEEILEELIAKKDLSDEMMHALMQRILNAAQSTAPALAMTPAQVAASLVLLRAKGEAASEIASASASVSAIAKKISRPNYFCADIVGTGGDGANTINVSTMASMVAASQKIAVAKHGNVSVSSRCGSADVLRELGIDISMPSADALYCLEEISWCFLYAPLYHPAFKAVKDVRQELKIKTLFNILGPLVNPIDPAVMVVGVYHERFVQPVIHALKNMGKTSALVVHGSGLDEIALHGKTTCAKLYDGQIESFDISPSDMGLKEYSLDQIKGGDIKQNAQDFREIISGKSSDAKLSMVAASAGALLWIADVAPTLVDGVNLAQEAMANGSALNVLEGARRFGHGA